MQLSAEQMDPKKITLTAKAKEQLAGKQILYIEREQYAPDHHNTATLFQKEEINESSFFPGGAMRIFDVNTGNTTTLIELKDGLVRDPELSFDGKKIIFSMRKNKDDFYHIYEINTDGSELKQLTFAEGVSDIDPLYLPDGGIVCSSTRQPKYCMCNRHITVSYTHLESSYLQIADRELGYNCIPKDKNQFFKSIYFYGRCDNVCTFSLSLIHILIRKCIGKSGISGYTDQTLDRRRCLHADPGSSCRSPERHL